MAANIYTRTTADGETRKYNRSGTQGRKPSGLSKPFLIRIYSADVERMTLLAANLGEYWNQNDFVREAVRLRLDELSNSVYTELP